MSKRTIFHLFFKILGRLSIIFYPFILSELLSRICNHIYSYRISVSIHAGKDLYIRRYIHIENGVNIYIGDGCQIFNNAILASHPSHTSNAQIVIGDGCIIGESTHISCSNSIIIGNNLLTGRRVTITDNNHGNNSWEELLTPPNTRKLYSKGGVEIGNNVWLGDNVIVLPGIKIGDGCVIGANSVVTSSLPQYCIAVGNPAKIVKKSI